MKNLGSDSRQRILRLQDLIDESKLLEAKLDQQTAKESLKAIYQIVNESNQILFQGSDLQRAQNTSEAVLDSVLLKVNYELVSKVFQQATSFNDNMYINSILDLVSKETSEHWDEFSKLSFSIGKQINVQPSLNGQTSFTTKSKKQRQHRRTKILASEKQPEITEKLERQDMGSDAVKEAYKQLVEICRTKQSNSIPYYIIIIDPKSFANTVYNAFQISFLVRENLIAIEDGSDGYPSIRIVTKEERNAQTIKKSTQKFLSLNQSVIKKFVDFYGISNSMLHL